MWGRKHQAVLAATAVVTFVLLLLGSVVHATESSLACPDWPTCFGTMMPEMEGGVLWEHTHRLVAGLVLLMTLVAAALLWRGEPGRPWVRWGGVLAFALVIIQAVLGGLTVLLRLPDLVSISHLAAAFLFLAVIVSLTLVTSPRWGGTRRDRWTGPGRLRAFGWVVLLATYAQSLLGAAVRHTDAGVACPDIPLCLGRWVPALDHPLVALHYSHRVLAVVAGILVLALVAAVLRSGAPSRVRAFSVGAGVVVLAQIGLGFAAVYTHLGVVTVSLHTGGAALLLVLLTGVVVWSYEPEGRALRADVDPDGAGWVPA